MKEKLLIGILSLGIISCWISSLSAGENKGKSRIVAQLSNFEREYLYSFPIEFKVSVGHADAVCPMAEFTVIEPDKIEGKKIRIIYLGKSWSRKRIVSKFENTNLNEAVYELLVTRLEFENKINYIQSIEVKKIKILNQLAEKTEASSASHSGVMIIE